LIGNTEFVQSPLCAENNIHLWNTETSSTDTYDPSWKNAMQWATTFHNYLAVSNLNAFIWWAGARPCTNNEALIRLEEALPG
ncbi:glycosyl hydrolase, partial [Klebsiella oxytoca]